MDVISAYDRVVVIMAKIISNQVVSLTQEDLHGHTWGFQPIFLFHPMLSTGNPKYTNPPELGFVLDKMGREHSVRWNEYKPTDWDREHTHHAFSAED